MRVVCSSYGADLSSRNNKATQDLIDSKTYQDIFPITKLNHDVSGVFDDGSVRRRNLFEIVGHKGYYKAVGIGGSLTGFSADLAILDDAIKNQAEAESFTRREQIFDWYRTVLRTRLSKSGLILVIGTRWHPHDPIGKLLSAAGEDPNADQWTHLSLPAIASGIPSQDDQRAEGEALWPSQYPIESLEQVRASLGSRWWQALYQQDPVVQEAQVVKAHQLRFYETLPAKFDEVIQSWDLSFQGTDKSDWTVGQVWARKGPDRYLLYMIRDKLDFMGQINGINAATSLYPDAIIKLIEHAANADALLSVLKSKLPGLTSLKPKTSKLARLQACMPEFEAGNVWFPKPSHSPWVKDLIDEVLGFGSMVHDDTVDAMTQALIRMKGTAGHFTKEMLHGGSSSSLPSAW